LIEVSVCDEGPGISAEDQRLIFEPFYQAGDSLTRTASGTGLGLAITKDLVEAQGGTIKVESELGHGTCFTFTMPVFDPAKAEVDTLESVIEQYRERRVISMLLVTVSEEVDDGLQDVQWAEMVKALLTKHLPRKTDEVVHLPDTSAFAILLCGTTTKDAKVVLNKLRGAFDAHLGSDETGSFGRSRIIGPASYPVDGKTAVQLLEYLRQQEQGDADG
jgi:hypothetical protein